MKKSGTRNFCSTRKNIFWLSLHRAMWFVLEQQRIVISMNSQNHKVVNWGLIFHIALIFGKQFHRPVAKTAGQILKNQIHPIHSSSSHSLTLILALKNNYILYKVWGEITQPFPNSNGATVGVWEWMNNFIPHFTWHVITYPWRDSC